VSSSEDLFLATVGTGGISEATVVILLVVDLDVPVRLSPREVANERREDETVVARQETTQCME
jgi:hypothetical protein